MTERSGEILDIAYADPARATELARAALDAGDPGEAMLYRALGVAQTLLGDFEGALTSLRRGADAAVLVGDDEEQMLAVLTMAGPTTVVGTIEEATALVDTVAGLATTPYRRARLSYQRAVLSLRAGKAVEAAGLFEAALPALRDAGDVVTARAALQNLGLVYIQAGELSRAERALEEALALASARGEETAVSGIEHNLGLLASYRGDIPRALELLADSEQIYMRLTGSPAPQHVARCEVLLTAGLFTEAHELAVLIARANRARGDNEHLGDALLVAAKAAMLEGMVEEAAQTAADAAAVFRSNARRGLALEAELLSIEAEVELGGHRRKLLRRTSQIVTLLERERNVLATAQARLLAARIALGLDERGTAMAALSSVAAADAGPVDARVRARVARARLRLLGGDRRGADAAARSGLRLIDRYQALFGATDIRMGLEQLGAELGAIGMELAVESGDSRRLLAWMERTRARALRHRPVSPSKSVEVAETMALLRKVEADLRQGPAGGDPRLERERRRLQEAVRAADRTKRSHAAPEERFEIAALLEALGDRPLLEIAIHADRLLGVVAHAGRARRLDLGPYPRIASEVGHLRFALRRGARMGRPLPLDRLAHLDGALIAPAGLPTDDLVLIPPPPLMAMPWAALPSLEGRPFTVVPSAEMWWRATRAPVGGRGVTVVGGPDLTTAAGEVEAIGGIHAASRVLPPGSPVADALAALGGVSIAHVACHARFEARNPMFSSLRLGDGDLSVYDLERLESPPDRVVLSACDSGYTEARAGVELAGLTSALLSMGTRSVVASVGLVPDAPATTDLMASLHRGLAAGLDGSRALAAAQSEAGDDPLAAVAAASFLHIGA